MSYPYFYSIRFILDFNAQMRWKHLQLNPGCFYDEFYKIHLGLFNPRSKIQVFGLVPKSYFHKELLLLK